MPPQALRDLLEAVAQEKLTADEAFRYLKHWPVEDLGFARVDHHRELRQGMPEVIFASHKTPEQVQRIAQAILENSGNLLCTRASAEAFAAVKSIAEDARFHAEARAITVCRTPAPRLGVVGVLAAGTSDVPVAEEAAVTSEFFGADVIRLTDVGVAGLHRLLDEACTLDRLDVAIVVAGMEGALPSVVGGLVPIPIIAVPTSVGYGVSFGGVAALLGMLSSCASGVTVVNIDNGFGAAAAARRILHARAPLK